MATKTITVLVNGHKQRARLTGRDYETTAGRAAARSLGRRASSVYSVRDDGVTKWGNGDVRRYYEVQVITGQRNGNVWPRETVRVAIDV